MGCIIDNRADYRDALIDRVLRDVSHQTSYCDGYIYRHIRLDERCGPTRTSRWRVQLTRPKKKILRLLLKRDENLLLERDIIVTAFDKLLPLRSHSRGRLFGRRRLSPKLRASRVVAFAVRLCKLSGIKRRPLPRPAELTYNALLSHQLFATTTN